MTLYEIDNAILDCIDMESGEILDADRLEALQLEREAKIENVALWYKNELADAEAYKAEKSSFAEREARARKKAESLKAWLDRALAGQSYKSTRVNATYRKSEQVVVDDIYAVNEDYLKYSEPTVDKVGIKQAIKAGLPIKGVHLEEKYNLSIR